MPAPRPPRIAVFTHDTFGLGHVRRCMHLIRAVAERSPGAALLLVTGSAALSFLEGRPPTADYVRIPSIVQTGSSDNRPPHLPLDLREISTMRRRLIRMAVTSFQPDVFLVDNFPMGSRRELLSTLAELRELPTRTVLGLRDILDEPATVRHHWAREGVYEVLERDYDRVLVYGIPEVMDVAEAYHLSPAVAAKVHYCGYVTDPMLRTRRPADVHADVGLPSPWILATVGGGGDGMPLLRAFLGSLELLPDVSSLVVTGPLMSAAELSEVESLAAVSQRVEVRRYLPDLPSHMAAADLVLAMGGYNTTAEILGLGCPAVIVPRNWRYGEHARGCAAGVEWEQLLRAQALEKAGLADLVHPDALTPELLAEKLASALQRSGARTRRPFDLSGAARVSDHLIHLAGEAGATP